MSFESGSNLARLSISALFVVCLLSSAWAQTQPAPGVPPAQMTPTAKPAKKPAAKPKTAAKPTALPGTGPCEVGVIAATQDIFTVQKIGLTVFGNDVAEVLVPWNLDDLVFARARAAAGAIPIRKIAYSKGAFDSYYHPQGSLSRNHREELTNVVRQIAANAGCERYLVVVRSQGQFPGTNQPITGLGIVNRSAGVFDYSFLFAHVGVIVFDGRTFDTRKDPNSTLEGFFQRMAADLAKDESLRKIDNSAFPATPPDAAGNVALRDNARSLLTERLDKILPAYFGSK